MTSVLILYYSRHGSIKNMARQIARGVDSIDGVSARLRTVSDPVQAGDNTEDTTAIVDHDDLRECDGLILGSPARFGNMAAPLKYFLETTTPLWLSAALVDKPAGVFTSSSSMHGGQETTLLSMMLPLLHHGMIISGIPYTEAALNDTRSGGTPYGPSHVAGVENQLPFTDHEKQLCRALGQRIARQAQKLKA